MWLTSAASRAAVPESSEGSRCSSSPRCSFTGSRKYFSARSRTRHSERAVASFGVARVGPHQPAAVGQGQLFVGGHLRHVEVLPQGGHPRQHVDGHVSANFGAELFKPGPRRRLRHPGREAATGLDHLGPVCVPGLVLIQHFANGLQDIAGHVVGGELLQHRPDQLVLTGGAAELQLVQQLLGRHLPQGPNHGLQLLLDVGPLRKIPDDALQLFAGLLVPLALQQELGDLLAVLQVLRVDLVQQDRAGWRAGWCWWRPACPRCNSALRP